MRYHEHHGFIAIFAKHPERMGAFPPIPPEYHVQHQEHQEHHDLPWWRLEGAASLVSRHSAYLAIVRGWVGNEQMHIQNSQSF